MGHDESRCERGGDGDGTIDMNDVFDPSRAFPQNEGEPVWNLECALVPIEDLTEDLVGAMLYPVVKLPLIEGENRGWLPLSAAKESNDPWGTLIGHGGDTVGTVPDSPGLYWEITVPLALILLVLAVAFTAIRAGTMSRVRVKQQFRRVGIVFLASFLWLPLAALGIRFFHRLALFIAVPPDAEVTDVAEMLQTILGSAITPEGILFIEFDGAIVLAPLVALALLLAITAAVTVVVLRWALIIAITVSMPLILAIWAFDAWPLDRISQSAENAAALFAGLLVSGLPSAVLIRVLWAMNEASSEFLEYPGDPAHGINPFVGLAAVLLPIFVVKATIAATRWATSVVSVETATAGQRSVRHVASRAARRAERDARHRRDQSVSGASRRRAAGEGSAAGGRGRSQSRSRSRERRRGGGGV
jgi:hypothetical protein